MLIQINIPRNLQEIVIISSLRNIMILNSVTSFGSQVFRSCISLKNIIIPNKIYSTENQIFFYCLNLESATRYESIELIRDPAFSRCGKSDNIIIPNSFTFLTILCLLHIISWSQ